MPTAYDVEGPTVRKTDAKYFEHVSHSQSFTDVLRIVSTELSISIERCRDLEIGVKGHWRSSKPTCIDPSPMISY